MVIVDEELNENSEPFFLQQITEGKDYRSLNANAKGKRTEKVKLNEHKLFLTE